MKYKCIVDRFYSEIYEKYKSIHHIAEKHNREDIYYKFNSQFSESKKYAERNPRFTYLSIELNKLAKLWDDILVTSRKLNKNIEEIVEPAHKFIFIPSTRIARNKPEASLYCKKLPPDNRLISIRITASSVWMP